MVNRILVAVVIALTLSSVSRAGTCTYTADDDANDYKDDIVLRRAANSGTTQYKISWCDTSQNPDVWVDVVNCSSNTSGVLTDSVVINAGVDADRVRIISGGSVSSSKCGSISGYTFVSNDCSGQPCSSATITVNGGTWNDHISVEQAEFAAAVEYPVAFYGGSGNDCIWDHGTNSSSILWGGGGGDYLEHNGASNATLYGDTPCSGGICGPSGADCVNSFSDFDVMDCGGGTDKYQENGYGTVSNCESDESCTCGVGVLVNEGSE